MSSKEAVVARIMVMLDCLLDTRIGTLAKIDPERAAAVLESGGYHTRNTDCFPGFTKEEFDKAYAERDVSTLEKSILTECVRAINNVVGQLREQSTTHHYQDKVEVVVNYYPYQLDKETLDLMGVAVSSWITNAHSVKLEYIPYEDMTPKFCDDNYSGMFIYDYDNWWGLHTDAFRKKLIPGIHLWAPAIWFAGKPSDEELEKIKADGLPHPMHALEMLSSILVKLQLIDVRFFSLPDPKLNMPS